MANGRVWEAWPSSGITDLTKNMQKLSLQVHYLIEGKFIWSESFLIIQAILWVEVCIVMEISK